MVSAPVGPLRRVELPRDAHVGMDVPLLGTQAGRIHAGVVTMPRVCLVSRTTSVATGTARYAAMLAEHLPAERWDVIPLTTAPMGTTHRARSIARSIARRGGLDPAAFLASYPVRLSWPEADVYHLTGQTFSSVLLLSRPPGPVVVTVHDIIPFLVRRDRRLRAYRHALHELFDRLAMFGLRRAQALI